MMQQLLSISEVVRQLNVPPQLTQAEMKKRLAGFEASPEETLTKGATR